MCEGTQENNLILGEVYNPCFTHWSKKRWQYTRSLFVFVLVSILFVIGFLVVFFLTRISYNSRRSRSSGGSYGTGDFVSPILDFGRGIGILDALISLIEKVLPLF